MTVAAAEQWLDETASGPLVVACGVLALALVIAAVLVQAQVARLRRELAGAQEELVDRQTGLLPRSAIGVRLGTELAWAQASALPLSIAVLRVRGSRFVAAARVLRRAMRAEEQAFVLGDQRILVELWDTDADAAAEAARRLGAELARAGHPVVDAGVAAAPRDGREVEELIAAAMRDLRLVDDPIAPGRDVGPDGRARGALGRAGALLVAVLPWFALHVVALTTAWILLPDAMVGDDRVISLITVGGLSLGAAFVHLAAWNFGGGRAPSSHPLGHAGWKIAVAVAALVGVPLAWQLLVREPVPLFGDHAGAMLAMLALIVLTLLHARQLVAAAAPVLVVLAASGLASTWLATHDPSLPLVANAGRLVTGAALGALLAKFVERASWLVLLAALAGGLDIWSLVAGSGVSNQLLNASSASAREVVSLFMLTGPRIDGVPLFELGVTDLVFVAMFLAWSHDWRLDMRVVTLVLVAGTWGGVLATLALDEPIPLVPIIAGLMIVLVAVRSLVMRRRGRAWRSDRVRSETAATG